MLYLRNKKNSKFTSSNLACVLYSKKYGKLVSKKEKLRQISLETCMNDSWIVTTLRYEISARLPNYWCLFQQKFLWNFLKMDCNFAPVESNPNAAGVYRNRYSIEKKSYSCMEMIASAYGSIHILGINYSSSFWHWVRIYE